MTWGVNEGPRASIEVGAEVVVTYCVSEQGKAQDRQERGVLTDYRVGWITLDRGEHGRRYNITPRSQMTYGPEDAVEISLAN